MWLAYTAAAMAAAEPRPVDLPMNAVLIIHDTRPPVRSVVLCFVGSPFWLDRSRYDGGTHVLLINTLPKQTSPPG
jgi:hypothetical protein